MNKDIRILLVDDHQVVREGLRRMLELEKDMDVVGEAADAKETLTQVESLSPEVILMDVMMPGMNGIEVTRQLREKHVTSNIIMLTMYDEYLDQALEAGANGYLLKTAKCIEVTETIRKVQHGQVVVSESISQKEPITELREDFPNTESIQFFPEIMDSKFHAILSAVEDNAQQVVSTSLEDMFTLETLATQSQLRDIKCTEFSEAIKQVHINGFGISESIPTEEAIASLPKDLPQPEALALIPEAMARKYNAIPISVEDNVLQVAITNPEDVFAIQVLATQSQMQIELKVANAEEIQEAIDFNYKSYDEMQEPISSVSLPNETTSGQIIFNPSMEFSEVIKKVQIKELAINETIKSKESRISLPKDLPKPAALKLIPEAIARKYNAIPITVEDNVLQVAITNPDDIFTIQALATQSQMHIDPKVATAEEIQEAIDFNYQSYDEIQKQISSISLPSEITGRQIEFDTSIDSPVASALSLIIDKAIAARASDIHFQPEENRLRVSLRIDGILHDMLALPLVAAAPLISRIKILANMNIADYHRPQDGHFSIKTVDHRLIDIRVGSMPTVNGEMAALRLLDKSIATMTPSELGLSLESLPKFANILEAPYGMILISGPTGAGKTTTLYSAVNSLDLTGKNIVTIEDPVEYRFERINQAQVNTRAGLTFASGLRSIVRLDPDVILVGEIRDAETAEIAIQSALTGHLVLSSVHANDAIGVVFRLLDLGVKPFLIASALIGVVAQRMVRKICPNCAQIVDVPSTEQLVYSKETGEEKSQFLYGSGCKSCAHTGYSGRTGIFEILSISDEIRSMVLNGTSASELQSQAINEGMTPLIKDGMLKVKANITTPSEVLRVAYSLDN
jgi:type II secretory ATPase GspE/PulE/Tfp pilus assembly ATPase PilB-like protein/DNA-binding NarL/FixJ family response regulator